MMRRILVAVVVCLAAAACAAPQTALLRGSDGLPRHGAVSNPVFFAQQTKECGPAALAMVLSHAGVRVTPDELVDAVYNPGRGGSLTPAVLAAARRHGRIAYPLADLASVLRAVGDGRPVLVLQNLGLQWIPQWHYAVVVGYDLDRGSITLHSGVTRFLEMPLSTFEHTWARGGYWGLVTLRPGDIPEPVAEYTYVEAIAGVERAGRIETAAQAYRAAAKRWPRNLVAGMGLGNTLYGMGDRHAAAAAYRSVTKTHPRSADAFNNLAHVLAELGDLDEAERAARTAIRLGGTNSDAYRETLESVLAARKSVRAAVY